MRILIAVATSTKFSCRYYDINTATTIIYFTYATQLLSFAIPPFVLYFYGICSGDRQAPVSYSLPRNVSGALTAPAYGRCALFSCVILFFFPAECFLLCI